MNDLDDLSDKVLVDREWYDRAVAILDGRGGCPFCGSHRPPYVDRKEGFTDVKGCLDCDRWWGKPRAL